MRNMFEADFVKIFDVVVVECIVNFSALAAIFDNFGIAENGKLVRNGGFSHIENVSNVADAHFVLIECPENFDTGGVAEDFEELGESV